MNNSNSIASQKALEFIKKNQKKFYREWYKRYNEHGIMMFPFIRKSGEMIQNPSLYAECYMIINSLKKMGFKMDFGRDRQFPQWVLEVREKHLSKFHKLRVFPMNRKTKGQFPHMDKTKAIVEFIARGFVHEDDYLIDYVKKSHIKCNIAPLVWPDQFESQAQALHQMDKVGIPGYTGTVIAKNIQ